MAHVTLEIRRSGSTGNGLPGIEGQIARKIEERGLGQLTGAGSGNGSRDFSFKTAQPEQLIAFLQDLVEGAGYSSDEYRISHAG